MRLSILTTALLLACAAPAAAQTPPPAPAPVSTAAPADVASAEAIVAALYDVISGDRGVARNWDRFRALFHPTARLMPSGLNAQGVGVVRSITPDEYITLAEPVLVGQGFHEREIARRSERFGRIVHVWTTYESLHALSDARPFARGINSIQLFHDGTRWWILSVYWQGETPAEPIPNEYLPSAG
ncbi:MAG: hypothetical protein Q7U72_05215 [Brevundimonas sp.]|uniref:hypothetical protein n=1 Tax=Brevundimonas sp. TaxID=1871086 RepID=UPI00271F5127|nr:hypothetical protein [Brevundimonas sp.]MDO9076835.1 hypothetical protein [Brevundimonas sp.]MDZ4059726.1 hypothetical protein [Brevundimonas sp.]